MRHGIQVEQLTAAASTGTTVLEFGYFDFNSYFGVDDISVVPGQPAIGSINISGSDLTLNALNGASGRTYVLLSCTNAAEPLSQWSPIATNVLNASGDFNFTVTNAIDPRIPEMFYILQIH